MSKLMHVCVCAPYLPCRVVRVRASQEGDREAMLLAVCSRLAGEREREGEGEGKGTNKSGVGGKGGESRTAGKDSDGIKSAGVNQSDGKQQRAGVIVFR